jgi:hypothetical protein
MRGYGLGQNPAHCAAMPTWTVEKYIQANGNCPIDKWKQKELTAKDRVRLVVRIEEVERVEHLAPNTIEKYKATNIFELKQKGDNKQLRPLGIIKPGVVNTFLLLSGGIEKDGKIPQSDLDRAERLRKEFLKGNGSVKSFFED